MNIETIIHIINLILAPVVMISGCALIMNGMLQRYESVGGRLRLMHRELLDLLRALAPLPSSPETPDYAIGRVRQAEIETQIPRLMRRYTLLRNALVLVEGAVIIFVLDMFAIALVQFVRSLTLLISITLIGFLVGVTLLLLSLLFSIVEIVASHREVAYEATNDIHFARQQSHPEQEQTQP